MVNEKLLPFLKYDEVRIFVSSSQKEWIEARHYLKTSIFPSIEEKLKERGIRLSVVFGYQGEGLSNHVFSPFEIGKARSYPVFIGILGGCYGQIPKHEDVDWTSEFSKLHEEKLLEYVNNEKSITEMEIRFGVLDQNEEMESYFYFGNGLIYYDQLKNYQHTSHSLVEKIRFINKNERKLDALKDEIKSTYDIHYFDNQEALGDVIYHDLCEMIEKNFSLEALSDEDRLQLNSILYEKEKSDHYVEREEIQELSIDYLELFDSTVYKNPVKLIVGEPGIGKSAFISRWSNQMKLDKKVIVLQYHLGYKIKNELSLLRSILTDIKQSFNVEENIPNNETIKSEFETWLDYINQPTLVIIDGIDRLNGFTLSWLPKGRYHHVELLMTFTGTIRDFQQRFTSEYAFIELKGFNQIQIEQFISNYPALKHQEIINQINSCSLKNNPFFLTMIGNLAQSEALNNAVFTCSSLEETIQFLVDEYKRLFGEQLVMNTLGTIELSREGLIRQELETIVLKQCECAPQEFNRLFALLEPLLVQMNGLYQIGYESVHQYINQHLIQTELLSKAITNYFEAIIENHPIEIRHKLELCHHYNRMGDDDFLLSILLNQEVFVNLASEAPDELMCYLSLLQNDENDLIEFIHKLVDYNQKNEIDEKVYHTICHLLKQTNNYLHAILFYKEYISFLQNRYQEDDQIVLSAQFELASLYHEFGDERASRELYQQIITKHPKSFSNIKQHLAEVYLSIGEVERAIPLLLERKEQLNLINESSKVWKIDLDLAIAYSNQGKHECALEIIQPIVNKQMNFYGEDHPLLWETDRILALLYKNKKDYEGAIQLYEKVIDHQIMFYGEDSPKLWDTYCDLAALYEEIGLFDQSIHLYLTVIEKQMNRFGEMYLNMWNIISKLAQVYCKKGNYDKALTLSNRVYQKRVEYYGKDTPETLNERIQLGKIYFTMGDYEHVIELYESLAIQIGNEDERSWTILKDLAISYNNKGLYDKAIDLWNKLSQCEEVEWSYEVTIHTNLANAYSHKGEFDLAIQSYEKGIAILTNQKETTNIWFTKADLAQIYMMKKEFYQAICLLEEALENLSHEFGKNDNRIWNIENNLAVAYCQVGEYHLAIPLLEETSERFIKIFGDYHPEVWSIHIRLASAYRDALIYEKAILLYQNVIEKMIVKTGKEDSRVWTAKEDLAQTYLLNQDHQHAISLFEEIIAHQSELYGEDYLELWEKQMKLAELYKKEGNLEKTITLLEKVSVKQQKNYGEDYIELWNTKALLADAYALQEQLKKAIELLEQVIEDMKVTFGLDYTPLWNIQTQLANLYHRNHDYEKAILLYEETIQFYGDDHKDSLNAYETLATLYRAIGMNNQAIFFYQTAIEKYVKHYGEINYNVYKLNFDLGKLYFEMKQYDQSITIFINLFDQYKDEFPVGDLQSKLADAYYHKGSYLKAIDLYENVIELSKDNHDILETRRHLAESYRSMGKLEKAISQYEILLERLITNSNRNHPLFIQIKSELATAYDEIGDIQKAIRNYEDLVVQEGELNKNNLQIHTNLAFAYEKNENYDQSLEVFYKVINVMKLDNQDSCQVLKEEVDKVKLKKLVKENGILQAKKVSHMSFPFIQFSLSVIGIGLLIYSQFGLNLMNELVYYVISILLVAFTGSMIINLLFSLRRNLNLLNQGIEIKGIIDEINQGAVYFTYEYNNQVNRKFITLKNNPLIIEKGKIVKIMIDKNNKKAIIKDFFE